jgi:hypothetical protein
LTTSDRNGACELHVLDEALRRGQHRVGGVHDGLGLAGRAGRVDQLHDLVGLGTRHRQPLLFGAGQRRAVEERLLERGLARATHCEDVLHAGQVGADLAHHRHMVEAAPQGGDDSHLGLAEAQHEAQLALAEDRHQRIGDGADAVAGEEQRRELPPVRQLEGDHVALADTALQQPRRDSFDSIAELRVREPDLLSQRAVPAHERRAPRTLAPCLIEKVDGQPIQPQPPRCLEPAFRQIDIERHGASSPPSPCAFRGKGCGRDSKQAFAALPTDVGMRTRRRGLVLGPTLSRR